MTLQPGQFFRDIGAVGEINHFFQQPLIVRQWRFESRAADSFDELFAVTFRDFRDVLLNFHNRPAHHFDPVNQVPLQMGAFAITHLHHGPQCFLQRLPHRRPEIFFLGDLFVGLKNAGGAHEMIERDGSGQFEGASEAVEFAELPPA